MIDFERVTVTYDGASVPTLCDASFSVPEGELCLVVGSTGSGKSTLLGAVNGLVPRFTGGVLAGRVTVAGRDTARFHPRDLADIVGVVAQDPLAGFVTDTVAEELAYCMEQLAVPPSAMRKRVEEIVDVLGLADLRDRALAELSGGQQQRVAIGSVLAAQPSVLVLDEPTSALDPTAAEDVLAAITRLVHDLGLTVLMAEHRLERVVHYADSMLVLDGTGSVTHGPVAAMLADSPVAPPVVELGRLAGWEPLPSSVRDARRRAPELRERLAGRPVPGRGGARRVAHRADRSTGHAALSARGIVVRYGDLVAVAGVDLSLDAGSITALMGRNGSGKSSLLWALQGSGPRDAGAVDVAGADPGLLDPRGARAHVALVPQTPSDLLYLDSVAEECAQADRESGVPAGRTAELLGRLAPGIAPTCHPRDLSEGQKLTLVLAIQIAPSPPVVLLDEPTRGLDYGAKRRLADVLDGLAAQGRSIMIATHDVEFVARVADRVVLVAEGAVVADGPCEDVVVSSPAFAPQVAKILRPDPYLTVDQVAASLEGIGEVR
ncbi:MAG: ATP-binding cassette domain-containing protein [Actinobacteria bacterium]|nr:ATP-binding cassette domain-containing protein [Actinomycetota bacterium]